jgi:UDP-N-acetylmuramoyl-L-alanyl-D-glutamate--2,6-diaminopimelate ligase
MMAAEATRRSLRLSELLGVAAGRHGSLEISDLVLDSRDVAPGAAFVALLGARAHGLDFATQALARGAAVVLYEPGHARAAVPEPCVAVPDLKSRLPELARRFFGLAVAPTIVGVTGTNGKTTVAYLLAQALGKRKSGSDLNFVPESESGRDARRNRGPTPISSCAYIGTLGFGVPPVIRPHRLTTPDCLTLHRELAALATTRVAMEVSSHALAQDRIAGLRFHTAAFTNLTRDHLDEHGSLERYGRAKARLFELPDLKAAVVNANDPFAEHLAGVVRAGCELVRTSIGAEAPADIVGEIRRSDLNGIELAVSGRFGNATLASSLVGDFNAENLVVALGTLLVHGFGLQAACEALAAAKAAPGRMELQGGPPAKPWVVVDYAHTPDALERVLRTLKKAARGELIVVFGCGGERDRGKRELMGEVAAKLASRIVITDDNPRREDPVQIVKDIRAGLTPHRKVEVIRDRRDAIAAAIAAAHPGDVVVIAGKGHEDYQIVAGETRPFSDRAVVAEVLGARP